MRMKGGVSSQSHLNVEMVGLEVEVGKRGWEASGNIPTFRLLLHVTRGQRALGERGVNAERPKVKEVTEGQRRLWIFPTGPSRLLEPKADLSERGRMWIWGHVLPESEWR
jgi:hypothetical protein